jgi:hypothetical protein
MVYRAIRRAVIRLRASPRADVLGVLRDGERWEGDVITGEYQRAKGIGGSNQWVEAPNGSCVWLLQLREDPDGG